MTRRVCTAPQIITFDLFDEADVDRITSISFSDDDTLTLAGWGPHPRNTPTPTPEVTPTASPTPVASPTPIATVEPVYGDRIESARNTRFVGQYDLREGTIRPLSPIAASINNPCGDGRCRIEVLDESPNGRWQLLHVWSTQQSKEGAWLVDESNRLRLGDWFVPRAADWQWSQDGTMLWYVQYTPGYGLTAESIIVELTDPPIVRPIPIDWEHPLDANAHRLAFSPPDKIALSVIAPEYGDWNAATRELFVYDLTRSIDKSMIQEPIEGLAYATWNEATQSIWLVIIEPDGVVLQEWSTDQQLRLPYEEWTTVYDALATGTLPLSNLLLTTHSAIAPSYDRVAISESYGNRFLLFTCAPE